MKTLISHICMAWCLLTLLILVGLAWIHHRAGQPGPDDGPGEQLADDPWYR